MRIECYRSDAPDTVVVTAAWDGERVTAEGDDAERDAVLHALRPTPVVTDDPALRQQGTRGEVLVQPGSLEWFRAAARVRVPAETGLAVRFVPGVTEGGYDPASQYRTFEESMARLTDRRGQA